MQVEVVVVIVLIVDDRLGLLGHLLLMVGGQGRHSDRLTGAFTHLIKQWQEHIEAGTFAWVLIHAEIKQAHNPHVHIRQSRKTETLGGDLL